MQITPLQFSQLVEALTIVLPLVSPADVTLKQFFRASPQLGSRDRAVIAENDLRRAAQAASAGISGAARCAAKACAGSACQTQRLFLEAVGAVDEA